MTAPIRKGDRVRFAPPSVFLMGGTVAAITAEGQVVVDWDAKVVGAPSVLDPDQLVRWSGPCQVRQL